MFIRRTQQKTMIESLAHARRKLASGGYGMMLLVLFITSTVLIGTSISLMLGSVAAAYLGAYSQDTQSATEAAQSGMETVLADIQSKLNQGTTVDTSYTYSSTTSGTSTTMPNDPGNLGGGGTTTIGTYTATMTAARGNTYLVNVVATVNGSTTTYSKLITMSRSGNVVDALTGGSARAIYSVRKVRSAYNGKALRVRRASDNSEQDIGFDGNGNLDLASVQSFLSSKTMPLDSVGSAAAAFGMRRLRNGYTGNALQVRRSSDSATQDIGFTTTGDLDVNALLNFVGTGTGYVTIWYDQSGNAQNATQTTTTMQPTIVVNGVLNMDSNRPVITYDGVDDYLNVPQVVYDDITITAVYNAIVGQNPNGNFYPYQENMLIDSDAGGPANDFSVGIDQYGHVNAIEGNPSGDNVNKNYATAPAAPGDGRLHWMAFTRTKSTAVISVYTDNGFYSDTNNNTSSLNASNGIRLSCSHTDWNPAEVAQNSMSEVLMYGSVLSNTNLQTLKRNQSWYYNISLMYTYVQGAVDAVNSVSSTTPVVAYGLRQLYSSYAGSAIKVRRSSDSTTQNIGFDTSGNLDVASLLSFVGTGSGYIVTWYDQSGHGLNATQSTTSLQPTIVNAGSLYTINGKPAIYFSSDNLHTATSALLPSGAGSRTLNGVYQLVNTGGQVLYSWGSDANYHESGMFQWSNLAFYVYQYDVISNIPPDTNPHSVTHTYNGTNIVLHEDGAQVTTAASSLATTASTALYLGGEVGGAAPAVAYIAEVVIYGSVLSTGQMQALQQSQDTYYSSNPPAAYVTKWYDQSGNGYDLAETNTAFQPSLMMPAYGSNNSVPTVYFNGNQRLSRTTGMPTNSDVTFDAVVSAISNGYSENVIQSNTSSFFISSSLVPTWWTSSSNFAAATTITAGKPYTLMGTFANSSKLGTIYQYNRSTGSGTGPSSITDTNIGIGGVLTGTVSEAMIFNRVLSTADRTTIYNDQMNYFGAI